MENIRKKTNNLTNDIFYQIKRLKKMPVIKSMTITAVSQSRIYNILKFLNETSNGKFNNYINKRRRKKCDKSLNEIKVGEIFAQDNSLTLVGACEIFSKNVAPCSFARRQLAKGELSPSMRF